MQVEAPFRAGYTTLQRMLRQLRLSNELVKFVLSCPFSFLALSFDHERQIPELALLYRIDPAFPQLDKSQLVTRMIAFYKRYRSVRPCGDQQEPNWTLCF